MRPSTSAPVLPVPAAVRSRAALISRQRAPTPLLPAIRALSRAGDNDTDDAATLEKRRLGLNSRDLASLGLRPSTGMQFGDLGMRSYSEGNLDYDDSMQSFPSRSGRSAAGSPSLKSWSPKGWVSASGSRASTARVKTSSRHRLGTPMLGGISSPVELQNVQLDNDLERLYLFEEEETEGENQLAISSCAGRRELSTVSPNAIQASKALATTLAQKLEHREQEFDHKAEATMRLIAVLHEQHQGFSPGKNWNRRTSKPSKLGDVASDDEDEEGNAHERLLERLEFYKMAKKFNPEPLPPLTKNGLPPPPRPASPGRIEYNMSEDAMRASSPQQRKARLLDKQKGHAKLLADASVHRQAQNKYWCDKWSEELEVKRLQAEAAIAVSRQSLRSRQAAQALESAKQWLTICTIASFVRHAHRSLSLNRDEFDFGQAATASNTLARIQSDPESKMRLHFLAVMWKARMRLKIREESGRAILQCLQRWHRGQALVRFRSYSKNVSKLQTWWREVSKRLHEIRDGISKRWEQLERAELVRIHGSSFPALSGMARGKAKRMGSMASLAHSVVHSSVGQSRESASGNLCLTNSTGGRSVNDFEESVVSSSSYNAWLEGQMVPEAKRLRFIENELRAQRYFLLPEIALWREELKKWEQQEAGIRVQKYTLKREVAAFFRMPPTRPSYLPLPHLGAADRGGAPCPECSKWCEGKRGDKVIMQWCAKLKSGEGWTEIPCIKNMNVVKSDNLQKQRAMSDDANTTSGEIQRAETPTQQQSLFGSVAGKDELEKWGVGLERMGMPGLDLNGENSDATPIVYAHGVGLGACESVEGHQPGMAI